MKTTVFTAAALLTLTACVKHEEVPLCDPDQRVAISNEAERILYWNNPSCPPFAGSGTSVFTMPAPPAQPETPAEPQPPVTPETPVEPLEPELPSEPETPVDPEPPTEPEEPTEPEPPAVDPKQPPKGPKPGPITPAKPKHDK